VHTRGPLARSLAVAGLICGGLVALSGGIALGSSGLVAVGVAGAVSAALAAGVAREAPEGSRASAVDAAWKAAAWTVGGLLVVSGLVVLAGGVVAALVTGLALAGAGGWWLLRTRRARGGAVPPVLASAGPALGARPAGAFRPGVTRPEAAPLPVAALPTPVLGREWLRTTAALAGRLDPAARQAVVRRREETLDELERRDPAGFARWLAESPAGDPARFVRGDQAAGTDAA
jgi:hypothetical protein